MTFSAVGLGDVQGVRNFSRFPTLGHPFYLAHRWTTRQVRGTFDDQGAFSFSPSTDIPSVPAGTFTAGWCPATDRENGKRQKERKWEWEREREGKRRERERESERKKKIKKRKKRTFFTIPLLDELARYRVAWRSNRTERGGERDETEEGNIESVGWGVWTALPRWTQRIAITNWQAWLMVSAEGTTPADPLAGREEERERRIGREERREKGNRMCQETEGVATGRRGCRPSEMEWM